ncbi:hypothetical protein Pyrfu_0706 [Pyrolobus fumarii 1A]|uniref:Uncharacterized protein n=1 Tax=Pyrolobus fumarii (strain DSM 11204 / 1A) TaxID=694429 RepID=G0ED16_PYRF1|nr:hypothetical protein [Pyrolobus fumarii]AEM38575.1 hypothetical protein Pyrfu_0706 [Pyrolobus fumarii 1A]
MATGDVFWRLVEALAIRMCGWCTRECIAEAVAAAKEGVLQGKCGHVVRDAMLAVEAELAWYPVPRLDASLEEMFAWAVDALYKATIAEVFASRRARSLVASRGLWTRRVVERILHDYWLAGGEKLLVTDARVRIGWVAYPVLASCQCGEPRTTVKLHEDLSLEVSVGCGECIHLSHRAEPPLAARLAPPTSL